MLLERLTTYIPPHPITRSSPCALPSLTPPRNWPACPLFALLLLVAIAGPALPAPGLAGTRLSPTSAAGAACPYAMDVLSNLPFAAIGLWGLRWLHWLERAHEAAQDASPLPQSVAQPPVNTLDCAWMFFAGLLLTAAGSAFYHLQPDDLRLAADRAGMAVAFAGLIGLAVCERVSARAGWPAAWFTLAGGLLAVAVAPGERQRAALGAAAVRRHGAGAGAGAGAAAARARRPARWAG